MRQLSFKYYVLILVLSLGLGCKTGGPSGSASPSDSTVGDPTQLGAEEATPIPLIKNPNDTLGDPPPLLDSDLVLLQSIDPQSGRATVTGLPGAAADGITEVCAQHAVSLEITCAKTVDTADGVSFSFAINGAPGDAVKVWGNGPTFAPGGPDINSITEFILVWSARYPSQVNEFVVAQGRTFMAGNDGLYSVSHADSAKSAMDLQMSRYTLSDGLPSNNVVALAVNGIGSFWAATDEGIVRVQLDSDGNVTQVLDYSDAIYAVVPVSFGNVTSLASDDSSRLWIGTGNGVFLIHLDGNSNVVGGESYLGPVDPEGVMGPSYGVNVADLHSDQSGSVWVATGTDPTTVYLYDPLNGIIPSIPAPQGLYHLEVGSGGSVSSTQYTDANSALCDDSTYQVTSDHPGSIWVAQATCVTHLIVDNGQTLGNENFVAVNSHTSSMTRSLNNNIEPTPIDDVIHSVVSASENDIWFAEAGSIGHIHVVDGQSTTEYFPAFGVRNFSVLPNGDLWIGSIETGLSQIKQGSVVPFSGTMVGLPNNRVNAVLQESASEIWVGTEGGLSLGTPNAEKTDLDFTTLRTTDGLPSNQIKSLAKDYLGNLWIASPLKLTRLTRDETGQISMYSYSSSAGLPVAEVSLLVNDGATGLWMSSPAGLVHLEVASNGTPTAKKYTTADGMVSNQVTALSLDSTNQKLWIGTTNGVSVASLDGSQNVVSFTNISASSVSAIAQDTNGGAWLGVGGYLRHISAGSSSFDAATYSDNVHQLNPISGSVQSLAMIQGKLWIGTSRGQLGGVGGLTIATFDAQGAPVFQNFGSDDGLPSRSILSIVPRIGGGAVLCMEDSGFAFFAR